MSHSFVLATAGATSTSCGLSVCSDAVIAVNGFEDSDGNLDLTNGNTVVVGAYDSSGNPTSSGTITVIVF